MKKNSSAESVTIWTRSEGPDLGTERKESWDREVFEDLGFEDLVRTRLDRYSGGGPGEPDMALLVTVTSRAGGSKMIDTTHMAYSPGYPDEVEHDVDPIFLGRNLAAEARMRKILYVSPQWPEPNS